MLRNRAGRIGDDVPDVVTDPRTITLVAVLVGWQAISLFFSPLVFPGLGRLAESLYVVLAGTGRFQASNHIPITLLRMIIGFAVAVVAGTALGIGMGVQKRVEDYLLTPALVLLAVPAIVWAYILLSWWGLTTLAVPVVTVVLIIVPYVAIHTWEGTKDVDYRLVEMADAFGASRRQRWVDVYLPHLGPYLFSTLRNAFAISWKIVLIGELFGTTRGVGFAINYYFNREAIAMVITWALPVMLLVYVLDRLLKRFEDRFFEWRETDGITTTRRVSE